ncbi:hypothetical protein HS088_TW11G00777 [Tripterygium wilfordii]|uniref:Uncharacterized protein n=1 Tax=Tripterygium wilfordii TaxID=458696 RepID=A0A7J7D2X8_TRIWF|nr:hypothetical protein HS088_TW11G00777 [Tripterygium wilfordii]
MWVNSVESVDGKRKNKIINEIQIFEIESSLYISEHFGIKWQPSSQVSVSSSTSPVIRRNHWISPQAEGATDSICYRNLLLSIKLLFTIMVHSNMNSLFLIFF